MYLKRLVQLVAVLAIAICGWQLVFSLVSYQQNNKADEYATQQANQQLAGEDAPIDQVNAVQRSFRQSYVDSVRNKEVFLSYTFEEVKNNALNLGLDLQGGMSVVLEVSMEALLRNMAGPNASDDRFTQTIVRAKEISESSQENFINNFCTAFYELYPNQNLTILFANRQNQEFIDQSMTNEQVKAELLSEGLAAIDQTFEVLNERIDRFGVTSPTIAKLAGSDRILIELPGADDPEQIKKLLQSAAKLEFWEAATFQEAGNIMVLANQIVANELELETASTSTEDSTELLDGEESSEEDFADLNAPVQDDTTAADANQASPLLDLLNFNNPASGIGGPVIGAVLSKDTAEVNRYLSMEAVAESIPENVKITWGAKANNGGFYELFALKRSTENNGGPTMDGDIVLDAQQNFDQFNRVIITMQMTSVASEEWERMTAKNVGKYVAIALDNRVYTSPVVNDVISGGNTQISGDFSIQEAKLLANILKAGNLKAPVKIVQESLVGPTLGKESIQAGIISLLAGLAIVLLFMLYYYAGSGLFSVLSLLINLLLIFGVLASIGATLTLPGIAGIVLTIGMAVDANVIIYERIREEILSGKSLFTAIVDGFKNSYSSIIDANVTTLITAIILITFGYGPIKGFGTVLCIGILTSLFSAVLINRLFFDTKIKKNKPISIGNKATMNLLRNPSFKFISNRKKAYVFSAIVIIAGIISFSTKGFEYGVDFSDGRAYEVVFKESVSVNDVRASLNTTFGKSPVVKTSGGSNRLKIITTYLIDSDDISADSMVQATLYKGLEPFIGGVSYNEFSEEFVLKYEKVEASIADDIIDASWKSTIAAVIFIFLYILIRFRKVSYSVGAIAATTHDVLFVLAIFSLLSGILPFTMEIDQAFIAAILTVIGYSVNDTVIVFDRIRETLKLKPGTPIEENVDIAINNTLSRTLITSGTTLVVLLVLFIFGSEVIRGFSFAILIGVLVGTYSSVFIASPLVSDLSKKNK